jgi:hypothetical protein
MKEKGEQQKPGDTGHGRNRKGSEALPLAPTLPNLGTRKWQSSRSQQFAALRARPTSLHARRSRFSDYSLLPAIPRQGSVKISRIASTAQPFHAVVDHSLAGVRPLLFRHMRLSIPIGDAFVKPKGAFGSYLLFGSSPDVGGGTG